MRTTIRLPDDLLAQAKRLAAERQRSLTSVIEDALREALSRQSTGSRDAPVKLVTVSGRGLMPGIDLDDSAALLEIMESESNGA